MCMVWPTCPLLLPLCLIALVILYYCYYCYFIVITSYKRCAEKVVCGIMAWWNVMRRDRRDDDMIVMMMMVMVMMMSMTWCCGDAVMMVILLYDVSCVMSSSIDTHTTHHPFISFSFFFYHLFRLSSFSYLASFLFLLLHCCIFCSHFYFICSHFPRLDLPPLNKMINDGTTIRFAACGSQMGQISVHSYYYHMVGWVDMGIWYVCLMFLHTHKFSFSPVSFFLSRHPINDVCVVIFFPSKWWIEYMWPSCPHSWQQVVCWEWGGIPPIHIYSFCFSFPPGAPPSQQYGEVQPQWPFSLYSSACVASGSKSERVCLFLYSLCSAGMDLMLWRGLGSSGVRQPWHLPMAARRETLLSLPIPGWIYVGYTHTPTLPPWPCVACPCTQQ